MPESQRGRRPRAIIWLVVVMGLTTLLDPAGRAASTDLRALSHNPDRNPKTGATTTNAAVALAQARPGDPHAGAYTRGLGVACSHCHVPGAWSDGSRAAFATTLHMQPTMDDVNAGPLKGRGGISCYTCHGGRVVPERLRSEASDAIAVDWPATATVAGRDATSPAKSVYRNVLVLGDVRAADIRDAMSSIAAALGVNCEYCHAGDEWDSDNKPAKKTAREMLRMSAALPRDFTGVASAWKACYICHRGAPIPER